MAADHTTAATEAHLERVARRRHIVKSYRAKADSRRTFSQRFADFLRTKFGSVTFLGVNTLFLIVWIMINNNVIPGIKAFDPYPFGLLVLIICLEAIVLDIVVLISQDRAARIAEIREEAVLHISAITEEEVTKLLHLVTILAQKQGISLDGDSELADMLKPIRAEQIEEALETQLR
jgi:uncharacterized membrane protein